jgi:hypothetical protein
MVRVRHLDGTVELVPSAVASGWMEAAQALFNAEQQRFADEFRTKAEEEGPVAAWRFLDPWIRTATEDVVERARILRAVELLVGIQRDLDPSAAGKSLFEAIRVAATARLVSYLTDPGIDVDGKELAIGTLGRIRTSVLCHGRNGREVDGVLTYDLSEPIHFPVYTDRPTPFELKSALAGSNPLLRDPAVVGALLHLFETPSDANVLLRGPILRSLSSRPELLDRVKILDLASGSPGNPMEEALVHAFSVRPDLLTVPVFSSMLERPWTVGAKALLWERFPDRIFDGDRKLELVRGSLPVCPVGDLSDASDMVYRGRVLAVVLERYQARRDPELLDLLVGRFREWAPGNWSGMTMPIAVIANFAARGGYQEFAPYLRGTLEAISTPSARVLVESALRSLGDP